MDKVVDKIPLPDGLGEAPLYEPHKKRRSNNKRNLIKIRSVLIQNIKEKLILKGNLNQTISMIAFILV